MLNILDLIYPRKCIFCEEVFNFRDKSLICDACENSLVYLMKEFSGILIIFKYDDKVKHAVHNFKYNHHPEYASILAKLMFDAIKELHFPQIDYIVPIPMYPKKKRKRGFNQAEILAVELGKLLSIQVCSDKLTRIRNTKAQSLLHSDRDKAFNVKGAFRLVEKDFFKGKSILLIDDISTSGNTIFECRKLLYSNEAKEVFSVALAKRT